VEAKAEAIREATAPTVRREAIFTREADGSVAWEAMPGDRYEITGTDRDGRRFTLGPYERWQHARCYNIWRGTFWLVRGGKRHAIMRVTN
jgi:hypothetical protein